MGSLEIFKLRYVYMNVSWEKHAFFIGYKCKEHWHNEPKLLDCELSYQSFAFFVACLVNYLVKPEGCFFLVNGSNVPNTMNAYRANQTSTQIKPLSFPKEVIVKLYKWWCVSFKERFVHPGDRPLDNEMKYLGHRVLCIFSKACTSCNGS